MSAVLEAASAGIKDMADGSLRLTIEFEPRYAQQAFALFGARGTPLAIAALKTGYAAAHGAVDEQPTIKESLTVEKPKGGALAKLAGMWCQSPEFWIFASTIGVNHLDLVVEDATQAKLFVLTACEIDSRAELDHNDHAAELFHRVIRGPYQKYLIARGVVS